VNELDVAEIIDALCERGVRFWVAGGWGVDTLLGRRTRTHRDVDLALDARDERNALAALNGLGYIVETDQRPARVEVAAPGDRWVDLHPVVFGPDGVGRQSDLGGGQFEYPQNAFTTGSIGGIVTPCLSVEQQFRFRQGYLLRPQDVHDIAILESLRGRTSED
jgi:lincosamide nucleotidyltransferase A/C/D/E